MFSLQGKDAKLCDGIHRRELLRIGGLSALGVSLSHLLRADAQTTRHRDTMFGRAKNVIVLWLQGGPPQHETWDPKPDAPSGIRGEFRPICTNVPGIQFCELLPRTAALADKLAVVRSMVTGSHIHSVSGYQVLTGFRYRGSNARQIHPSDWPYFGSVVRVLKPSTTMPAYTTVWLPNVMRLNENVQPAGQTAGFLGRRWDPQRIVWDPSNPESQIEQFSLPANISLGRLSTRQRLLTQLDDRFRHLEANERLADYDQYTQQAFSLLGSGRARHAFDISREPARVRDRYGRFTWGQCVLLARRLVEAGVRLVHVNWPREPGDSAVDNPLWDTHALNADRLQDVLCPQFDISFSALLEDLDQRGLLDETLVLAIGEFGRTPRINGNAGRDHWGSVFSFVLAGAGIRTAQVHGASDRIGAHPRDNPVTPADLTATLFHLLGIDPHGSFRDPTNRPHHITQGQPISAILGNTPVTSERRPAEGNIALSVPSGDEKLFNTGFTDGVPLVAAGARSRVRGWQADPLVTGNGFGVRLLDNTHAALGFWKTDPKTPLTIRQGQRALLAQEIRNARAGHYRFSVQACALASAVNHFTDLFQRHFTCKLIVFRYSEPTKDPRRGQQLATLTFSPTLQTGTPRYETVRLARSLDSSRPGSNFPIGLGLGVAVSVEKTSPGTLRIDGGATPSHASLSLDAVDLEFGGREINEEVQV